MKMSYSKYLIIYYRSVFQLSDHNNLGTHRRGWRTVHLYSRAGVVSEPHVQVSKRFLSMKDETSKETRESQLDTCKHIIILFMYGRDVWTRYTHIRLYVTTGKPGFVNLYPSLFLMWCWLKVIISIISFIIIIIIVIIIIIIIIISIIIISVQECFAVSSRPEKRSEMD